MIEIVQTGQSGKTPLLFDMHRLRKRVFKDRMDWNVSITPGGLEVDSFDLPDTVYILALSKDRRVIGSWRILPTSGPTMVGNIWPQFLKSIDMPADPNIWEASRFSVDNSISDPVEGFNQVNVVTQE